jgi:hypothetical protein
MSQQRDTEAGCSLAASCSRDRAGPEPRGPTGFRPRPSPAPPVQRFYREIRPGRNGHFAQSASLHSFPHGTWAHVCRELPMSCCLQGDEFASNAALESVATYLIPLDTKTHTRSDTCSSCDRGRGALAGSAGVPVGERDGAATTWAALLASTAAGVPGVRRPIPTEYRPVSSLGQTRPKSGCH